MDRRVERANSLKIPPVRIVIVSLLQVQTINTKTSVTLTLVQALTRKHSLFSKRLDIERKLLGVTQAQRITFRTSLIPL